MKARKIIRRIGKWLLIVVGSLIGFIGIILLLIRLYSPGKEEAITGKNGQILPHSIAMHEDRMINGVPQRLTIRGNDIRNPVLLVVHGGPGQPWPPVLYHLTHIDLEDLFTVCYWEQRGSGSAYFAHPEEIPDSTVTLDQIVEAGFYLKMLRILPVLSIRINFEIFGFMKY